MASQPNPAEAWKAAPYGSACAGCSRAKCKCFYQASGSECERCIRLGKTCEPATVIRKRKAQQPPGPEQAAPPQPVSQSQHNQNTHANPHSNTIEAKLDDIAALLRQQNQAKTYSDDSSQQLTGTLNDTPSTGATLVSTCTHDLDSPSVNPDVVVDTDQVLVHLIRPADSEASMSNPLIAEDVSVHKIPLRQANKQLVIFQRAFLPMWPFVHIPNSMDASELKREKPFLWLVVMALTSTNVSDQFAMDETIWKIISRRVVVEQMVSLDLLLGIMAFSSWSHYFKKDKPFMTMLTQMAVAMAMEMNLDKDTPGKPPLGRAALGQSANQAVDQHRLQKRSRTLEERRTMVSVHHLTSVTWTAYRKTEPLRLTPYIEDCLRQLMQGNETHLDTALACQTRCLLISNEVTLSAASPAVPASPTSKIVYNALLKQLDEIKRDIPQNFQNHFTILTRLHSTELVIRGWMLGAPRHPESSGPAHIARLRDLELTLNCAKQWLEIWSTVEIPDFVGINSDAFAQFTHLLTVLYKLRILDEPGWDVEEVKRTADVLQVMDDFTYKINRVVETTGMLDAPGRRSGLFFKAGDLFRAIKQLFVNGLEHARLPEDVDATSTSAPAGNGNDQPEYEYAPAPLPDDFLMELANEPWLSDAFSTSWDFGFGFGEDYNIV